MSRNILLRQSKALPASAFPPALPASSSISHRFLSTTPQRKSWSRSALPVRPSSQEKFLRRYESSESSGSPSIEAPKPGGPSQPVGQIEPRLQMTFTCTANDCGHRSTHEFAKKSYEKGIVLVQCPKCKARHLIADHLGWFKESTESGKLKTVEDLLRERGETIRKGRINMDGDIEYAE